MGGQPRSVFCDCSQEAYLIGRVVYHVGEYGTAKVLLLRGIKVIDPDLTLTEENLPVMEVYCKYILCCIEGHRVVLIHNFEGDDVHYTAQVKPTFKS